MPKDKHHSPLTDFRAKHRTRSHESAHAESANAPSSTVIDHPLVPRGQAPLIQDKKSLSELVTHLREAECFAYDSEFIGELTYVPKLCLIQVATAKQVALIDPLADLDLRVFWELVADPTLVKIVHAGQQDLEPVIRHLAKEPKSVFDTQIVAGFVGMSYPVSLSRLIQELLDVKMDKGLTLTQWDQRPLSGRQMRYAVDDVRYLPAVYAALSKKLEENGHAPWALEECNALCQEKLYRFDPDVQLHRVRGSGSLGGRELAILRELVIWRDRAARAQDVPSRAMVRDEVMVDLCRSSVKRTPMLDEVRGLPRPVRNDWGKEILQAIERGHAVPADQLPAVHQNENGLKERFQIESLWSIMQSLCAGQGIDSSLVGSRHDVTDFYRQFIQGEGALASHRWMQGWRREAVGDPLVSLLRGEKGISVHWAKGEPSSTLTKR